MEATLHIGDKVSLRKGLKVGEVYDGVELIPSMLFTEPLEIVPGFRVSDIFKLKGKGWFYTRPMLKIERRAN